MALICCGDCGYWDPIVPDEAGLCRRRPPVGARIPADDELNHGFEIGYWPLTYADDWCGDAVRDPRRAV